MAEQGFQEKTEKATAKRRQEAREKGQTANSREIVSVLILLATIGLFFFAGTVMFWKLKDVMTASFKELGSLNIDTVEASHLLIAQASLKILFILMPLFITVPVIGIGANIAQIGVFISSKALVPDFSKLNPATGIKRLVSARSFVELAKSMAKLVIVAWVGYLSIKAEFPKIPFLMMLDVVEIVSFTGSVALKLCLNICLALILIAVTDYAFQKFQHEKDLKMTKQEIKEEGKQTEGDPQVKQRIKAAQMEMVRLRMINTIPEATVIITNPTHFAVALKFDLNKMPAPMIIAKGAGVFAKQIKKLAKEHDIPIVENKPLAQLLFKTLKIGEYIPGELYQAVAEILAYIYKLKGRTFL